jgi:hypothetical protein
MRELILLRSVMKRMVCRDNPNDFYAFPEKVWRLLQRRAGRLLLLVRQGEMVLHTSQFTIGLNYEKKEGIDGSDATSKIVLCILPAGYCRYPENTNGVVTYGMYGSVEGIWTLFFTSDSQYGAATK